MKVVDIYIILYIRNMQESLVNGRVSGNAADQITFNLLYPLLGAHLYTFVRRVWHRLSDRSSPCRQVVEQPYADIIVGVLV